MATTTQDHLDCLAVVFGFFDALDMHANDRAVSLFAKDGVWERNGAALTGHEAISAALDRRPMERRTFHAVCNPAVSLEGESHAIVRFYLIAYEGHPAPAGDAQPLAPVGIRRCEDRLFHDGERWRIVRKSSVAHLSPSAQ